MKGKYPSVMEVLSTAFDESNGKTVDLVIDHGELKGITLEMLEWWYVHPHDTAIYKMWHPVDHVSFEWEIPPGSSNEVRYLLKSRESIGEFPASVLHIRGEDPAASPVPATCQYYDWSSILGDKEVPIAIIFHEHGPTPGGMKMRSVFRFPARTPKRFIDAMRKHSKAEMNNLRKILPMLYREKTTPKQA